MEHLNESIIAGERGIRLSRSSVMLAPKPRSPVHPGTSPPKSATPPSSTAVSRQASTPAPAVPTLIEEGGKGKTEGICHWYEGMCATFNYGWAVVTWEPTFNYSFPFFRRLILCCRTCAGLYGKGEL